MNYNQYVQYTSYVFETILLLPHTNTYLHGSYLTNVPIVKYYILLTPQHQYLYEYTLLIVFPIFIYL